MHTRQLIGIITGLIFILIFSVKATEASGLLPPQKFPVSASREIDTTISEYGYSDITESDLVVGYLPYNNSVSATDGGIPSSNGSADQNSWISMVSDTVHASGTAYGDAAWNGFTGGASVNSYSGFIYTFDVESTSDYLFSGNGSAIRTVSDALEAQVYADVYASLQDVTNSTYLHNFSVAYDGNQGFSFSGTLSPARYKVSINAQVDVWPDYDEQFVDATASYSMNLQLVPAGVGIPVPEPASVLLFLLGLIPLWARNRRCRR